MENVESSIKNSFYAQDSLKLGFDEVAREKVREQLELSPPDNALSVEENELIMFLLSQTILY